MARGINSDYAGKQLIIIGVLQGSIFFLVDLVKQLTMPLELDFIEATSYGGIESTGKIKIKKDISINIGGREVLLVEDIVDTGNTMSLLVPLLRERNPRSLKLAAFLDKPSRRKKEVKIDYVGKIIPNEFVVGYGLDYNGLYRNLPDVRIFKPES
jgi:hypoxanthine phosphoribosyltransferase